MAGQTVQSRDVSTLKSLLIPCTVFLLLFLLLAPAYCVDDSGSELKFYIYATSGCKKCQETVELLQNVYGEGSIVFYELLDVNNRGHCSKIIDLLVYWKIIDPLDSTRVTIPLSGVFKNGDLKAIVFGTMSEEDWRRIVETSFEGVPVYFINKVEPAEIIREQVVIESITEHFKQTAPLSPESWTQNVSALLPLTSLAAAADAVNPCELNAFLLLIVYVFYHVGKRAMLKTGLAFTTAVFVTYYLMGLGFLRVLESFHQLRWAIAAFGLIVGALEVTSSFGIKRKHIPDVFTTTIMKSLEKALNPYTAFLAGVIVSLLILPCTSGPYFIALDLMARKATLIEGLILLTVYNAIIIAPFLAVTFVVYTLTFRTFKLRKWISEKEKWLRLFAGTTMIFISLILVTT